MINRVDPKKQILLVDDEVDLTNMLRMLLETRGYAVEVASTGAQALKQVSTRHDLILLDLVLPDSSGFDICRKLKQRDLTRDIPIIMISAHSLYEDKVEGLYLGADDFLSKPCDQEELFARMEAVMRRGNSNGAAAQSKDEIIIFELRRILDEALVVPHFQPIYLLNPFELYGVEILTRPVAKGDLKNPDAFFKAALQYGLYTELEVLSWSKALECLSPHLKKERLFFNCNPYFVESSQVQKVKALFDKNHVSADKVVLEITERSAISDFKLFYEKLNEYREMGFQFAVDDVGGGYASLESIVETQPEVVKIDRHIIKDISQDAYKQSIVKFVISFCKENHILSVAEGIETKEDLDVVNKLGIDAAQGYYLFKPTPQVQFDNFRKSTQ